jgi:NAD(P)-dependent dehydrogenase (short-subunit alcohol dehydrogenase family)
MSFRKHDFELSRKVAVVTGGGGAIGGAIARAFAAEGASVAIWDIAGKPASQKAESVRAKGGHCIAVECDVTDRDQVFSAAQSTTNRLGTIDILVNAAGGSRPETTTSEKLPFFELPPDEMIRTFGLNYLGTLIPSQAAGRIMAEKKSGSIINITSIAGILPLTRAVSYSDAKAAVNSFTRWLAVHMAVNYSPKIRANAVAPGFILTAQNRFLLVDEGSGRLTTRGERILQQVPMSRFGEPDEIVGAVLWLASDMAGFVTGAVIPVDGGFSAFSGV